MLKHSWTDMMRWLWGMFAGLLGIYAVGTRVAFGLNEEDELVQEVNALRLDIRNLDRRLDDL